VFPDEGVELTPVELANQVERDAAGLLALDLRRGSVVILCGHNSSRLVTLFLSCQAAGLIPCIFGPSVGPWGAFKERLLHAIQITTPSGAFFEDTVPANELEEVRSTLSRSSSTRLPIISTFDSIPAQCPFQAVLPAPLSFIQFTSGSVLSPRAVMVSHSNLSSNCAGMASVHGWNSQDVCVSWLPLYHDMGLVGHLAPSFLTGWSIIVIDPSSFARHPARWLRLITEYRGTASGAPNFAYALCTKLPATSLDGIDLSSWKHAYNGSEPIRNADIESFVSRFRTYGFHAEALNPVYGLAESTLAVTFPKLGKKVQSLSADADELSIRGKYIPATGNGKSLDVVSVGHPLPGHDIKIVDPEKCVEMEEGCVGEILASGPSVVSGYLGAPLATAEGWLKTGDLGFRWKDELYITGRIKDVIKKSGRNIFAADVEAICLKAGETAFRKAVAFEYVSGDIRRFGIAVEVAPKVHDPGPALFRMCRLIQDYLKVSVDAIWLAPRKAIPTTTSGKTQRSRAAQIAVSGKWGPPVTLELQATNAPKPAVDVEENVHESA
jgi:acyl-CoA synthetase (AMP-forming)/AMP-acid ligase II